MATNNESQNQPEDDPQTRSDRAWTQFLESGKGGVFLIIVAVLVLVCIVKGCMA